MKPERRVEEDYLATYVGNASPMFTYDRLAAALGKPVLFMGSMGGMFTRMAPFAFNGYYPEVRRVTVSTLLITDDTDGGTSEKYISGTPRVSYSLTNGRTRVMVPGYVILYAVACIAAGTWVPKVPDNKLEELKAIGEPLVSRGFHDIKQSDTWGL